MNENEIQEQIKRKQKEIKELNALSSKWLTKEDLQNWFWITVGFTVGTLCGYVAGGGFA